MSTPIDVADHYTSRNLLERLNTALRDDGVDPDNPSFEALAPYDQFHGRGLEATEELAALLEVSADHRLLDVGSGIGGPARYMAKHFGCRVTGIDLTSEFCEVARYLNRLTGLDDKVAIEQGNALAMPFPDAHFDGAYSMNVSMNIEDKTGFYGEIHRVLKPGAWLVLSEIARGPGAPMDYPTPWAATEAASFLATPEDTRSRLEAAGYEIVQFRDATDEVLAFGARSKAVVDGGGKPLQRAVGLIHGAIATEAAGNTAKGMAEQRIVPIEVFCKKRG
jgi:ubiquinone/menaquinone biosynthesis C-methylase UbiE